MSDERLARAQEIAHQVHPHARASCKPRNGIEDAVAFGLPRNKPGAIVVMTAAEFDEADDETVIATIRAAWST